MQTVTPGACQLGVEVVEVQPSGYPTFFTNIQAPAGIEVAEPYGEVGRIPDAMVTSLTSTFEGTDAPHPHDVAEAIVTLVGQAKGSRAVRTVVGAPFGSTRPAKTSRPCNPRWSRPSASATSKKSPDESSNGHPDCP